MPSALLIVLGLAALIVGAELVVRYGARIARRLGIPPLVVGLTVVSIGTSAPELAVGIDAVRSDAGSLAVANIAGTNVVNLLLILGLSAVIRPIVLHLQTIRLDLPAMALAAVFVVVLAADGDFSVLDGVILTAVAVVYTVLVIVVVRRESAEVVSEFAAEYPEPVHREGGYLALHIALLLAGLVVIVIGADWLVDGSVELARVLGVSDALIGLTIIAIGTSAPELATTIISTIRGDRDIAIGNLIGSSTFNLTLILGVSLLFAPGSFAIDPQLIMIDLPVMLAVSLVCIPVFLTGNRVSRGEGITFVVAYAGYLGFLLATRT